MARRTGYSRLQIWLHWAVAFLVFAAYFSADGMGDAYEARLEAGATGIAGNTVHVWLGGAALVLILVRLAVRLRLGAPGPSEGTAPALGAAAAWGHRLIYLLLIVVPLLGALAWYGGVEAAGDPHETIGTALLLLAVGHALMAMWHEAMGAGGVMKRMFQPGD